MIENFIENAKPYISALLFAGWCLLHSVFADMGVKSRIHSALGRTKSKWYRFTYVVLSTLTLIGVAIPVYLWPGDLIWEFRGAPRVILIVVRYAALIGLLVTAVKTDMGDFLGFRQIAGRKIEEQLVINGAYRWVRHPLYSLGYLVIWANPRISTGGMAISIVASLYLWLGTYHEEKGLIHIFGDQYTRYARKVPRLIPRPRRKK